ncbi:hypothetical protein cypCar_00030091, partial [Cyprinus carpio]
LQVLEAHGLKPISLKPKEGLALINGTQMITSLGAEAVERAEAIVRQADIIAALTLEALKGTTKALDSGVVFLIEKLVGIAVSRMGGLYIVEVNLLPSKVTHLVIKRPPFFHFKPGDYVYINIPAIANAIVDGPFGTLTRQIFASEHAVLIGVGIGITPFASILQSIMFRYRMRKQNCPNCNYSWYEIIKDNEMKLRKVYQSLPSGVLRGTSTPSK